MTELISRVWAPASLAAVSVARAADLAGLDAVVVPYDEYGVDSLTLGAHLLRRTRYVRVYVGLEPRVSTPQYAAKLSASLQRFSHGRLGWYFEEDNAEVRDFVATARSFWEATDGLPAELSRHRFPDVVIAGDVIDVHGDPGEVLSLARELSIGRETAHV